MDNTTKKKCVQQQYIRPKTETYSTILMGRNKHKTIKFNRIIRFDSFFQTENGTFKQNL